MIDARTHKQQLKNVVVPKNSTDNLAAMSATAPSQHQIRERAYELYESRGRAFGQEEQDWIDAEQEILQGKRLSTTSAAVRQRLSK